MVFNTLHLNAFNRAHKSRTATTASPDLRRRCFRSVCKTLLLITILSVVPSLGSACGKKAIPTFTIFESGSDLAPKASGSADLTDDSGTVSGETGTQNRDLPANWFKPDESSYFPVVKVVDGDTVIVKISGQRRKLRLIGIDAPESVHNDPQQNTAEGAAASDFLRALLADREVRLEYDVGYLDQYGRDLCYLYLPDGTFVNEAIVRAGQAKLLTIPPNIKYADVLRQAQSSAQEDRLGIWGTE
ncbi:MAG: thermonuclease family protein [Clostridiales bacterium]|jgi:micrococcal nuclease|nr:thermonuclease family protein [Bacillota bacterium]NLB08775.1 thermonuclease family protein [Clostridiales bacterium]